METYSPKFQNGIRARTFYYKVLDMKAVVAWWKNFLQIDPHKSFDEYSEFKLNDFRIGFVLNSFDDKHEGNRGTIMFECETEDVLKSYIQRAQDSAAVLVSDNLVDPDLRSMIFTDPFGNEFEIGNLNHD